MVKERKDPHPLMLEMLSSILFGFTIVIAQGVGFTTSPVLQGYASLWVPILYAAAMFSVITMFTVSFINFIEGVYKVHNLTFYLLIVASFALLALTASDIPGTVLAILALLLGLFGVLLERGDWWA